MSSLTQPRMSPDYSKPRSVNPPRAHTKIVATIGPATEDRIGELIEAGMSVARLNLSHGSADDFLRRVQKIRREAEVRQAAVGILIDIQGPKMRMGKFDGGARRLDRGTVQTIRQGKGPAKEGEVYFDFTGFFEAVQPGHRILLADGQFEAAGFAAERVEEAVDGVVRAAAMMAKGVRFMARWRWPWVY